MFARVSAYIIAYPPCECKEDFCVKPKRIYKKASCFFA